MTRGRLSLYSEMLSTGLWQSVACERLVDIRGRALALAFEGLMAGVRVGRLAERRRRSMWGSERTSQALLAAGAEVTAGVGVENAAKAGRTGADRGKKARGLLLPVERRRRRLAGAAGAIVRVGVRGDGLAEQEKGEAKAGRTASS